MIKSFLLTISTMSTIAIVLIFLFAMIFNFNVYAKEGDEKVFAGWILHMFISGQLKEYTPRGGMTECLKIKRKIMRSQGQDGARWECKTGKLKLRHFDAGELGLKWLPIDHLGDME